MGRHHYAREATEADDQVDWEDSPRPAPLWRTRIVTSAVLLLAVLAGTWWAVGWLTSPAGPTGAGAPVAAPVEDTAPESQTPVPDAGPTGTAGSVTVHVAGEVSEPGLVVLPAGARVQDALEAAGGPTTEAVVDLLNLAAPAVDGSQVLVPGPESAAGDGGDEGGRSAAQAPAATGSGPGGAGAGGPGVNVNTADSATLEQLPGIGPALAGRIIDHREQVGPFGSLADLDAVSGIGPAMMERLDGLVSW
ncbi:ComEA family DNA-binding protein [Citricoccus sp. I39-566]|uniref:ComEA family DNA-binding protein n=1 Tax=Citricoccus sp. I39-566 TaxID=3073268 RepID=UPI00286C38DC|nr:ComEA family DNA-binding protein [Citricoccus sp. I39-566]WMY77482.1 ComEA family DNA-binding protein [Citricoccus sp. I39-566]